MSITLEATKSLKINSGYYHYRKLQFNFSSRSLSAVLSHQNKVSYQTNLLYTVRNYSVFYSVLLLNCYSERLFSQFTMNCCYFFTFIFVKYCVFYSVKCKMLRYIVKNIMKYCDFFNRQIRACILPTKYCKCCIFYSKPVIFLQETVFFYIKTVRQTKYSFCKNIYNILLI